MGHRILILAVGVRLAGIVNIENGIEIAIALRGVEVTTALNISHPDEAVPLDPAGTVVKYIAIGFPFLVNSHY